MAWIQRRCRHCGRVLQPRASCSAHPKGEIRYRAEWREPSGRDRSKTFRRRGDAERFLTLLEADELRGDYIDPAAGRLPLLAFWREHWHLERARLRPSTQDLYDGDWRRHIAPHLGEHRLSAIRRREVEAWIGRLVADGVGAPTVGRSLRLLHRVLEAAVAAERIARNPAKGVQPPRANEREMRFLGVEEVEDLLEATPERWRAFMALLAYGGFRIGELAALRAHRIDELNRTIRIEESYTEVNGKLHLGPTKTGAKRAVRLPASVWELLGDHMRAHPPRADGLVFYGADGGIVRRSLFRRRVFKPAVARAGLEDLRVHDLRHTAVSLAIATGAPAKAIQARAGHSSIRVTLDRYGHLLPSVDGEIADRLDAARRQAATRPQNNGFSDGNEHNDVARVVPLSRGNGEKPR